MQSSLKKSLYLGLAAVSFVAAGAAASTTNASAKTAARVTSLKSLKTDANTRNVVVTGSNAIGTKALTLRGASVVKSAATLKAAQAADKTGNYNYRAYAVATTNRGSVYYKVVSFDKTVRGWIYGGKSTATYAGGVKQFATASDAKTESKSFTYNGQKLWAEPAWTQYKVGASKLTMTNGTSFTVNASKTNVKSGDLYYQIADGSAKGAWVKASDLETATTPIANNQVKVSFVDVTSGKTVGSKTLTKSATDLNEQATINNYQNLINPTAANEAYWFAGANVNGYTFNGLTAAQVANNNAAVQNAKYGSEVKVSVVPTSTTAAISLAAANAHVDNAEGYGSSSVGTRNVAGTTMIQNSKGQFETLDSALATFNADPALRGAQGSRVSADKVQTALTNAGLDSFYIVNTNAGFKTDRVFTANAANTAAVYHVTSSAALIAQSAGYTNGGFLVGAAPAAATINFNVAKGDNFVVAKSTAAATSFQNLHSEIG